MESYDDNTNTRRDPMETTDDADVLVEGHPPITKRIDANDNTDESERGRPQIVKRSDLQEGDDSDDRGRAKDIVDFDSHPAGLRGNDYPGSGNPRHDEVGDTNVQGERNWDTSPKIDVSDETQLHGHDSSHDDQPGSLDDNRVEGETRSLSDLGSRNPEDHSRRHDDSEEADLYGKSHDTQRGDEDDNNDSKFGKMMQKAGDALGSETLAEKGQKKREAAGYDDTQPEY